MRWRPTPGLVLATGRAAVRPSCPLAQIEAVGGMSGEEGISWPCSYCGTTILWGGRSEGDFRFCDEKCRQKGSVLLIAKQIPDDVVQGHSWKIHQGACPKCGQQRGPVDVYTSYKVWSMILMTSWSSVPQISCRRCGVKAMLWGATSSLLVGWWGIPWGILMTPLQVGRNIWGLLKSEESATPSGQLEQMVRVHLASRALVEAHRPDQS